MKKNLTSLSLMTAAALILGAPVVQPAFAATDYWLGGVTSGNWSSGVNWLAGTAPAPFDSLTFTNQSGASDTANNDFPAGTGFDGITFASASAGSAFNLTGNSLLLSGATNGVTLGITNATSLAETVGNNLALDWGAYTFYSPAGSLSLNGTLTAGTGGLADFGGSNVKSSSLTADGGGLVSSLGGAGLIGNTGVGGGFTGLATVGGGVISAYTYPAGSQFGNVTLPAFTTGSTISNIELTATAAGNVVLNSTASQYINTVFVANNTANKVVLASANSGTLVLGNGNGVGGIYLLSASGIGQGLTIGGGSSCTLTAGTTSSGGTVILGINGTTTGNQAENNCTIKDNGSSGKVTVVKAGTGSMYFNLANTYSGGTYVDQGYLQINTSTGLGTGPVYVAGGAELYLQTSSGAYANNFYLAPGTGVSYSQLGDIKIGNGTTTCTMSGTLNLLGAPAAGASGDRIGDSGNGGTVSLTGQITGAGTLDLSGQTTTTTFAINNGAASVNNWTGGIIVDVGATGDSIDVQNRTPGTFTGNLLLVGSGGAGTITYDMWDQNESIYGLNSSGTGTIKLQTGNGATLTVGNNNASGAFGGTIINAVALAKIGSGTQTLSGVNTYTGGTTVNGGVLTLGTAGSIGASTQITVGSSGTLDVSELATPFTLNAGQTLGGSGVVTGNVATASSSTINLGTSALHLANNMTFNGGSVNAFTLSVATNGANGQMVIAGNLNLNNASTTVSISYSTLQAGRYKLIVYGGSELNGSVSGNNLTLAGFTASARGQTAVLDDSIPGEIDLLVTGSAGTLTWVGDGVNNNWDIQTTTNWLNAGSLDYFYNGDIVTFNDSGSTTPAVNLNGTLQPALLTITNNTAAYTFSGSGSLTGNFTLNKQGSGSLALLESGNDSFTGGIVANGGSLILSNNMNISGGITVNGSSSVTVAHNGNVNGNLTVNGGSASFVGSGTLAGSVAVNGGSLLLDQQSAPSGNTTVASGGWLQVGNNDGNGNLPAGSITDNGGLIFNRSDASLNVTTVIAGGGALTNNGSGAVTLSAVEAYTGPTVVNAGMLVMNGGNHTASGIYTSSALIINNGGAVGVLVDNSLVGNGAALGALPVTINAGGTLTGAPGADTGAGTSSHVRGLLTLNGGTLDNSGTSISPTFGSWDLDDGVATAGGPVTSVIACRMVIPDTAGGTVFNIPNGGTTNSIDLLVSGTFINGTSGHDTGIIKTGNGTMAMDNGIDYTNAYTGGITISAGTLQLGTPADTIGMTNLLGRGGVTNNATLSFASSQMIVVTNVIQGTGALVVNSGAAVLTAASLYTGNTWVNGGTLALAGAGSLAASPQITVSNAIFDLSGLTAPFRTNAILSLTNATLVLTIPPSGLTNSTISETAATLNLGGATNVIDIASLPQTLITSYPQRFHLVNYTTLNGVKNLGVSLPTNTPPFAGYLTNANGLVDLVLTGGPAPVRSLAWTGTDASNPNNWDVATSFNWQNTNAVATTYNQLDLVTFNDTAAGQANINLASTLTPSALTVSNNVKAYTFSGGGQISGGVSLIKQGAGALILSEFGGDNFTGGIFVSNGLVVIDDESSGILGGTAISAGATMQVGNNDGNGLLPAGAVTDNGSLSFNQTSDDTVANAVSGSGALNQNGANTVTLSGNDSGYAGAVTVTQGTLKMGGATAFGACQSVMVNNSGTLDVNSFSLTNTVITISGAGVGGNGALVNNGGSVAGLFGLTNLTLAANASVGGGNGGNGRLDLRPPSATPSGASLNTVGHQTFSLTKVGANQFSIVNTTVDPALGDIDVQGGILSIEASTTGVGNPTNTLTVENGAILQFYQMTNQINKNVVVNDGGTINNNSGNNTVVGPMTLNGAATISFENSGAATSGSLTFNDFITGSGSLTKNWTNTLVLTGPGDSYSGGTMIYAGKLVFNTINFSAGEITTYGNTTLAGNGTNTGPVAVGGLLLPGDAGVVGTFTAGGLDLTSGGSPIFDLNTVTNAGGGSNDFIQVNGSLAVNGQTITINPLGILHPGNYFLMHYTGALSDGGGGVGSFNPTPVLAGGATTREILTVDTTSLTNWVLLNVSGGSATLAWNNASGNGQWDVQTSANWSNLVSDASSDVFYPQDTVVLDDTITNAANPSTVLTIPSGVVVIPNVLTNNSMTNYTITGLGKISGAASLVKMGGSTLTISSTNDFTGGVTINGGTVQVVGGSGRTALGSGSVTVNAGGVLIGAGPGNDAFGYAPNAAPENFFINGGTVSDLGTASYRITLPNLTFTGGTLTSTGTNAGDANGNYALLGSGTNCAVITLAAATTAVISAGVVDFHAGPVVFNIASGAVTGGATPGVDLLVSSALINYSTDAQHPVVKTGNGVLALDATNTFGGSLTISNGTLQMGTAGDAAAITEPLGTGLVTNNATLNFASSQAVTVSNLISGTGSLVVSSGTGILTAVNVYSGNTIVSAGTLTLSGSGSIAASPVITLAATTTLDASGRVDGILTLAGGQTLNGFGGVIGIISSAGGSTIAPGSASATGTLTGTAGVTLNGACVMKLNQAGQTNDVLATGWTLTYGGTLNLTNLSGALAAGESFKLFNAASFSGAFAQILPATPGANLLWNTNNLAVSGTLSVISTVKPAPHFTSISLSGAALTIQGTNGTGNGQYVLLGSTNVTLPLSQWTPLLTNTFDAGGNFNLSTNIVNPALPQQFFILSQ